MHVLGNGQLGDRVAEQGELRLDPPPAPRRILARHAVDQLADLSAKPRPPHAVRCGPPVPVKPEALAVPGEDGRGLDNNETRAPRRPQARQPDPEDPVPTGEPGSADRALKDSQLMAQRHVFQGDGRRPEGQGAEEGPETDHEDHRAPPASDV
jgi:hypothetical protein